MSAHVLIVDGVAARRVLLRANLRAAHYDVTQGADPGQAAALAAQGAPDLVLLDLGEDGAEALPALCDIKDRPGPGPAVVALAPPERPDLRLLALRAGADEAMDRGATDRLLQARIRSLLRARDVAAEMALREEEGAPLPGPWAEAPPVPLGPPAPREGRVAVVLPAEPGLGLRRITLPPNLRHLPGALACEVSLMGAGDDLYDARLPVPDLYVIDGSDGPAEAGAGAEVLRLLADIRSRSLTRHAATLVMVPDGAQETAAMALDLGAGDVAGARALPQEIAARAQALMGRKSEADRLRERIQARLQAAVRDPLTGLHNRRYAEPTLERMAARARGTGRDFALLLLDLDYFKAINDTWGHAAGDRVLREVAGRLQAAVRSCDLVARIGGEEFLVALADATEETAHGSAERLRRAIEARPVEVESSVPCEAEEAARAAAGGWGAAAGFGRSLTPVRARAEPKVARIRVTASVGVAVSKGSRLGGALALADLFERADAALYAAKTAGRNRVATAA